eukprot:2165227-Rhodomonas_salina.2
MQHDFQHRHRLWSYALSGTNLRLLAVLQKHAVVETGGHVPRVCQKNNQNVSVTAKILRFPAKIFRVAFRKRRLVSARKWRRACVQCAFVGAFRGGYVGDTREEEVSVAAQHVDPAYGAGYASETQEKSPEM